MKKNDTHGLLVYTSLFSMMISIILLSACSNSKIIIDEKKETAQINTMLDDFNRAAAKADFNAYFNFYTETAIFTGTDATERWDKKSFMVWAKPFFDRGRAWNFTALERHIYFDKSGKTAWFDELLNTQMKICRGSGVLVKQDDGWKLEQYILSTTIPNELMDSIIKLKSALEDPLIKKLKDK